MSKFSTAIKLIKSNKAFFLAATLKNLNFLFPDKLYLQLMFRCKMGRSLDLKNPRTFNEKLQWLKLYNRNPLYTTLVDKFSVKKWVAERISEDHIIPTLGVWNNAKDIDFAKLPKQFVLKTTNGGGGDVVICKDRTKLDITQVVEHLNKSLKVSLYKKNREWPYKNVPPRIIAEKYMEDESGELRDYKFFCFGGIPKYCQVIRGRYVKETIDFYDMEWNHMPFVGLNLAVENGLEPVEKVKCLDSLVEASKILSNGLPFVRVDFYVIKSQFYFGEMTFYPNSGFGKFRPDEWNYKLGDLLKLPLEALK